MFNYDNIIEALWSDPLKYVAKFLTLYGVATPDYSIYPQMNKYVYTNNIFKNRWLGATWQSYGINVIPTISWCGKETFDICFSGVEPGGTVIISTLGVNKNTKIFIDGFNEMKKRLNPMLIIVVGKILPEMSGNLLLFELEDTFNQSKRNEQLSLFPKVHFICIKERRLF